MNIAVHPVAPEDVMAFLDGELSRAEANAVSAHLEQCAECAAIADHFRLTSQSLSQWTVAPPSLGLTDSISEIAGRTRSGLKASKTGAYIVVSFWNWKLWAITGGGAVAIFLLAATLTLVWDRSLRVRYASPPESQLAFGDDVEKNSYDMQAGAQSIARQQQLQGLAGIVGGGGGSQDKEALQSEGRPQDSLQAQKSREVAKDSNGPVLGRRDSPRSGFAMNTGRPSAPGPMIARSVSLVIVTKDFASSRAALDAILARHHGYAAQLTVSTQENAPRGIQGSLRIPAPELTAAVADLKTLGHVETESQSGEEVTAQHTDLVARLKTARNTEDRFEAILQQRTGNVYEVLQVEEGIARVRGEIESMEAQQQELEHRVDFAAIDLQLIEDYKAQFNPPSISISTRINNAFVAGIRHASGTLLGLVMLFEEYGPAILVWLLILGLPAILLWRRYRKMRTLV